MKHNLSWRYDEFKQVGRDYGNPTEVDLYDASHADFRNVETEGTHILDALGIQTHDLLIDFGSGTGTFAIQAARRGDFLREDAEGHLRDFYL
jgi:putative AdoMet-dependent methyltransferase